MLPWLALLLLLAPTSGAFAAVSTSHLPTDAAASALVESSGGAFRFATEVLQRDEDDDGKLEVRQRPVRAPGDPAVSRELEKLKNGTAVPFTLTFDGVSRVTLTVTPRHRARTVTNLPVFTVSSDLNELFVRTEARWRGARVSASNLVLNGAAISDSSNAVDNGSGAVDILRIRGGSLAAGFTLTGSLTMSWSHRKREGHEEDRTKLDVQIWGAKVVEADTTPPVVTITAPANGGFVTTARPSITASYSDGGSGVDLASVTVAVDGVNRTADSQVAPAGLTFTPSAPLAEGQHVAVVVVQDRGGNRTQAEVRFVTDTLAPVLDLDEPATQQVRGDLPPTFLFSWSDAGTGVDLASFAFSLDGNDFSSACQREPSGASCQDVALQPGSHSAAASLRDRAGNVSNLYRQFELVVDRVAPTISVPEPLDRSFVRAQEIVVRGTAADETALDSVIVNGIPAPLTNGSFEVRARLFPGENPIVVTATDAVGNQATVERLVVLDQAPPNLVVDKPASGQTTNGPEIEVTGRAADDFELAQVTVAGVSLPAPEGRFVATVPVPPGRSAVEVRALDRAGNVSQVSVAVERLELPRIEIMEPVNFRFVASTTLEVSGTVSDPSATVEVEGLPAVVSGNTFSIRDVPLAEGGNLITAIARSPAGAVGTATVSVVRDLTSPHLVIETPQNGAVVSTSAISVAGLVNDIVAGTVNAGQATVMVNGRPATVSNRSFVAEGVPLVPGNNTLEVTAVDEVGNRASTSVDVQSEGAPSSSARLLLVSGAGQRGAIGSPLAQPLIVSLVDANGLPVSGATVLFRARDNDGRLGDPGKRRFLATTDTQGRASARFQLGLRAGVQLVEATAPGSSAPVDFVLQAEPGPAENLLVDSGDQQVGVAGHLLPRPLVVVVTDRGWNRLEGADVSLRVLQGRGLFENQQNEVLVFTDSDGRAIVPFRLDPEEGISNNAVEARIEGFEASPRVSFSASGMAAGLPGATSISGIVLDNSSLPVAGVSVRIDGTPTLAVTDAQGRFSIAPAPLGTVRLIIDGSTAARPGQWPSLEFFLPIIPGRDNTVRMPIYLLPLNSANRLTVDETHGGRLSLAEVPGFALDIAPGSVTFPSGSRSGVVSVTVVHNDKVPMVPNFGQQPRFIVTIQPAGARFDPPARMTLPNVEGLAPGEVTEMYSFDHDLGSFVSIGPATVSDDGALIVSKLGVGVIKAGWHCGGNPRASATVHRCDVCEVCNRPRCVPAPDGPKEGCTDSDPCTTDVCRAGKCVHERTKFATTLELSAPFGPINPDTTVRVFASVLPICRGLKVTFNATNDPSRLFDGGHEHSVAGRPLGPFTPSSCTTNLFGLCSVEYKVSIAAGTDVVVGVSGLATARADIRVGRQDLQELAAGEDFDLIGSTNTHPVNHWGKQDALSRLQQIAAAYHAEFPGDETLHINDISLRRGGLFDYQATWARPHRRHRTGADADVRLRTVPLAHRARFMEICRENQRARDVEIHNGNHFHIYF